MTGTLAILGGRVIDPAAGRDEAADIFVRGGQIVPALDGPPDETIHADGSVVCPGFVEPHSVAPPAGVGSRWARQALAGGFTTAAVAGAARRDRNFRGPCPTLLAIAPLTVPGTRKLAEMAAAAAAGAVAFSDFPEPHGDAELLRRGLLYAKMLGKPVFDLPRDPVLSEGGVAAEGPVAEELGLFAVPAASERVAINRGIELANATEGRLHFAGLSDFAAVGRLSAFRATWEDRPEWVTAAISAAHLLCMDDALRGFDPAGRVDPPFRDYGDRKALRDAATDRGPWVGTLSCLTAGHRPDPGLLDPVDLLAAPPGFEAFETTLPAALTACGADALPRLVELLTVGPAGVLGLDAPTLEPGARADVTLFDPVEKWTCEPGEVAVPVARTPLAGRVLSGRVTHTVLAGRVAFDRGRFPAG